jgi:hypothetical protein
MARVMWLEMATNTYIAILCVNIRDFGGGCDFYVMVGYNTQ